MDCKSKFELFMSQLKGTIAPLNYFADFGKISKNVDNIAISLSMLNFLLGKTDLRRAVRALWDRDPKVFQVMDILIATRRKDNKICLDAENNEVCISDFFNSVDGVVFFLEETGLARLFQEGKITNLLDYVFGVETGLDSNARKNRGGILMEKLVATLFTESGIEFRAHVNSTDYPDLTPILGADTKCFDFVVMGAGVTYLIETNFYSSGGSKLNEVARSYIELSSKLNKIPGFVFIWITDGKGWFTAESKLREAFDHIPEIYILSTIDSLIDKLKKD